MGAPLATEPFAAFLRQEAARVDQAMDEIAAAAVPEVPEPLRAAVAYALSTRGKRLRPILFLASFRAASRDPHAELAPSIYRLASAVEIVHTYSLVHDDLPCMDDDDLRRGRPTVHRVHGVEAAMLAGAALIPLAMVTLMTEAPELALTVEMRGRLVRELCRASGADGMVGGQLMDLAAECREVDARALEAIHRAKTGALLTAAVRLGAMAAGSPDTTLRALSDYGEALGLAFQIADDILDVVGDAETLGKVAGRDHVLHKASYPSIHGLEGARALARRKVEEAKAALEGMDAPALVAVAEYVVERRH